MKSKGKRDETLDVRAEPPQYGAEDSANHAPNPGEIRQHTYELYLEGGGLQAGELDDWLRAEREPEKTALFRQEWECRQQPRRPDSGDGK